nr:aminopeptidase N-like [Osmia lignaria]XP_034185573.1 aminopeptidase N-like [Osmia lignaria]
MSRGSISSWQDYGRRSSQGIPQFSGGPVEFMTSDGMEYKRGDGWFLSYTKIAGIVVVFVIGVVAAGFLGWYINSLPKKKPYDTLDLLNDEIEDIDSVSETLISPSVNPLKYRLQLTPIININSVSGIVGRVIIEFRVNDATSKLSLNARNISVENYKLLLLDPEKGKEAFRRRLDNDEAKYSSQENNRTLAVRAMYSVENDDLVTVSDNETTLFEKNTETSSINNDSFRYPNQNKDPNLSDSNSFSEIEITEYRIDDEKDIHTIHLANQLKEGIYFLEIDYQIVINENAFFITNCCSSEEERWFMGTKLKRSGARYLFPVFDDTLHKSIFSVSVIHFRESRVLSNMPLRTLRDTSNVSVVIDTFDESPPLSPHNLAFLMGHIESIGVTFAGNSDVVVTFWGESNRQSQGIYVFDKFNQAVTNLIDVFSMPYPLPKLDVVGLPSGIDENMANPGLIEMKQSLFYASENSSMALKTNALRVLVDLLEQQWTSEFTNANRTDAWIFEGSMIYFQQEIVRKIDSLSIDFFVGDIQSHSMEIDEYSISRPLHENVNHRSLHSLDDEYAKGACLIRMLHGAINDTAFRNGYKKLISRWKYNTTEVADFLNFMQEEASGLPSEMSLEEAMNSWIFQGGYPLITVIRNYEKGSAILYQEQFTLDRPLESISKFWHVPLDYIQEDGDWSSPTKIWFQSEPKIKLDNINLNESWILFNVNKTGYYRVHYDERNWKLLKMVLQDNHELFPPETRASLIDDVFSLAAVGLMKYEAVFDFIKYMQTKERHYLPWTVLMRHTFRLNRLLYETTAFSDFQVFMIKFVSPLYNEVGSSLKEGSQLPLVAVKMACMFEHPQCLNWSNNVFENIKNDTELYEIVPSHVRETFYCTVARYGTRREWSYFTERITLTEDEEEKKRLLSAYACFQAPWILQSILNEIVHEELFQEDEVAVILKSFPRNPAAAQAASRFVRANWHEITQRFPGSYSLLRTFVLSMINGVTTEQDLEDLQLFRENNYESMKGARYGAALVEANGNFGTLWLKSFLPEFEKLLKEEVIDEA